MVMHVLDWTLIGCYWVGALALFAASRSLRPWAAAVMVLSSATVTAAIAGNGWLVARLWAPVQPVFWCMCAMGILSIGGTSGKVRRSAAWVFLLMGLVGVMTLMMTYRPGRPYGFVDPIGLSGMMAGIGVTTAVAIALGWSVTWERAGRGDWIPEGTGLEP